MVVLFEGQLLAAGGAAMEGTDGVPNAYVAENVTALGGNQLSTCSFKLSKYKEMGERRDRNKM